MERLGRIEKYDDRFRRGTPRTAQSVDHDIGGRVVSTIRFYFDRAKLPTVLVAIGHSAGRGGATGVESSVTCLRSFRSRLNPHLACTRIVDDSLRLAI